MVVTLKEVAERAGVSRSAVSRTFTPGASVSDKTRRKVERAAKELGYSPNALASSLTTGRTRMIGLVSNNFHNPIFLTVFDQFTRGLQARGLRPLLVNLTDEAEPANSVRMLRQYSVDAAVIASSTLPPEFSQAFRAAGVPVVNAFGRYSSTPDVHVVGIDNMECGRMAARTLLARGYSDVAFLGGPAAATSTQDRQAGFMSELAAHPHVKASVSHARAYSFEAGRDEMQHLLSGKPAQAYFCGDDVLSIGAISAIADAGLNVPGDIGIIGLNDMEMSGWENIGLTTIRQPIREIVNSAIELMVATMDDPDRYPEARLFPCNIVERKTLRPLPDRG
ncbi:LacI family DNA-binding transcriptional regulator [Paracoccus sp. 1_MG-2023]|uniref:LacI family DNA-binding transcriptional regulator n=1 Tax=unclassified Paracoccus (in: a-proteobacteria) TaxID=2688777 RepID=UPI001C0887CB|nr:MULTISPECIES: LacI family DNA-binding transcriptional regulator [unclassified Paracoccus (in: a-proteobacteria)]MBU2957899.1 LacI family transcriptional regulator [Paracoccus sp. C2R09]MDO6668908.1 LacI family DNA-binding transcriptional regulator [Paracoccus sp. 1_MG-2023]